MRLFRRAAAPILVLLLSACAKETSAPPISAPTPTSAAVPIVQTPPTAIQQPIRLIVWVPSWISPSEGSEAAALLADRLRTFEADDPSVSVDLRIRDEQGPGGLLTALSSASLAAPKALPDLIALNPSSLRAAALKGLLVPLNDHFPVPTSPDWYTYAVGAAMVDEGFFGIPFASDAEAFAVRTSGYAATPRSWANLQVGPGAFAFPGADPTASFTLAQYVALGGRLTGPNGLPSIAATSLEEILAFYDQARSAGILPMRIQQEKTTEEVWTDFEAGLVAGAHATVSRYLQAGIPASTLVPIPTRDGRGIALTQTWAWAMVARDPSRQEAVARLVAWLSAPEFLGPWTQQLGLLPPTRESLDQWPDDQWGALATRIALAARPRPTDEILAIVGPAVQTGVEAVLSGSLSPREAAIEAADSLESP